MWTIAAGASALFAGITSILAKCGIRRADADVATAIRTAVVLVFSWCMAALTAGDLPAALAALLAIVLFGETGSLAVRLAAIAAVFAGTMLMIDRKPEAGGGAAGAAPDPAGCAEGARGGSAGKAGAWLPLAVASAVFAALTSVLAKVGIEGVDSNLATAVRTVVVLAMAWAIVAARGKSPSSAGCAPASSPSSRRRAWRRTRAGSPTTTPSRRGR